MINQLIEAVTPRVSFADAAVQSDETLSVNFGTEPGQISRAAGHQAYLRVEKDRRLGMAGRDDTEVESLVQSALQSVENGPEVSLLPPSPAPLPEVVTAYRTTAALGPVELLDLARRLGERLGASGRKVETWAERSAGRLEVGNSRGVMAGYDLTVAGVGLNLRADLPSGPLQFQLHDSAAAAPTDALLAGLVDEANQRLAPPLLDEEPPTIAQRLWLMPRAVAALLVPLCQALLASNVWSGDGPLAAKVGEPVVSELITLIDDPLVPGRPGSRPIDDEGVICRRQAFIERGVLRGGMADLVTATRLGVPASGHGRRSPGAPAWAGWSNVVLGVGSASAKELAAAAGDGVLIRDLPMPKGNCRDGRIALSTPWAYRLVRGETKGRYERVTLKGNVFEWLNRALLVGSDSRWIGARCLPDIVIDGVELS